MENSPHDSQGAVATADPVAAESFLAHGRISQLSISPGGVPKRSTPLAVVGPLGLDGDTHRGAGHGGPERAVCLFSLDVIERLQQEGHPIAPGTVGENVTVAGLDWSLVQPSSRLYLGDEVVLEVTRFTTPCVNIVDSFADGKFERILQQRHPGESRVYTRVLRGGAVRVGDTVGLVE